jgi:hypothetical protein
LGVSPMTMASVSKRYLRNPLSLPSMTVVGSWKQSYGYTYDQYLDPGLK